MSTNRIRAAIMLLTIVLFSVSDINERVHAQDKPATPPEKFFGFQMGTDRKLARWDKLVEYYKLLEQQSAKIKVVDMGPSTMGNPFLVLFISSSANLARLEQFRQINATLSDPRGIPDAEISRLVAEGKTVVVQSMGLHASEVAASQMAAELVFDLITRQDEETIRILENVISIMIPCFNPDGEIMVTDWYNKYLGTEYEGAGLPVLYHKYLGHDTNRDAFQTNTVESQYAAKILFRDWVPQAYIDHHQMGSYGARFYVPPYAEPIRPHGDPLVWREMSWYGAHIAYKEEEAGLSGIVNAAIFSGWGHFGFHWITPFHNIAGMLTEAASARLATPLFIHSDQLKGETRAMPEYKPQTTFPNPWPGGWWHLRDIVDRQKVSARAVLDIAARNRETVLRNATLKASRQTERGAAGKPAAFIIPSQQHDPLTADLMINKLLLQGIHIEQAQEQFIHDGTMYGAKSFVISMAQPKMGLIRYLLGRTFYPDNSYTRDNEGNPIQPYDMATDAMCEFMGVQVDAVNTPVHVRLKKITGPIEHPGNVQKGAWGFILDGRLNESYRAMNLLFDKGIQIRRMNRAVDPDIRPGDFILTGGSEAALQDIARQTGITFNPLTSDVKSSSFEIRRLRIGVFQRYFGGNIDEGWTRWLLEQWGFPYKSLMDAEIKAGNLITKYDVIILPADRLETMTGDQQQSNRMNAAEYPPEYRSGFGKEGIEALSAFVEKGGTLVTFAQSGSFAIEKLELPVRNTLANRPSKEFWCPGSTLWVNFDPNHPLSYGMPSEGLAVFMNNNQAYEIVPSARNERVQRIVTFGERDILQSGWLIGESALAGKAAMISVQHGKGTVVLIGFRAQHRAQTHGTFKLVFNALINGPEDQTPLAPVMKR